MFFHVTTDAATELQVSNSKLAEVEAAYGTQKSEVRFFIPFFKACAKTKIYTSP